jgi:hypothetical protein
MAVKPFVRTANLQQSQPIVDAQGRPAPWFVRLINDNNGNVVEAINQIAVLPQIQEALIAAQQAAADAMTAADKANQAAEAAQGQTDATKREAALQGSYIEPTSVLTADPTTIVIASHTRRYADGNSAAVQGDTIDATAAGDINYVSYVDPEREGGAVEYIVSTTPPVQTGDTHVVGAVQIPATGTRPGGEGPRRPGFVEPYVQEV